MMPLQGLLAYCKELAVSYTGLLLTMDMFPQVGVLMHHQQQGKLTNVCHEHDTRMT
jgi:hypothetical protein